MSSIGIIIYRFRLLCFANHLYLEMYHFITVAWVGRKTILQASAGLVIVAAVPLLPI